MSVDQTCRRTSELLTEWCDATNCHGIHDLKTSKRTSGAIFWSLLLLAALTALTQQITALLTNFIEDPYTTHADQVSLPHGIEFPNITICNLNRINKYQMDKMNMSVAAAEYFSRIFTSDLDILTPFNVDVQIIDVEQQVAWNSFVNSTEGSKYKFDMRALAEQLAVPCNKMLVSCGSVFRNRFPNFNCCHENFQLFNCFGMCNVVRPISTGRKQYFAGFHYGISMIINPLLHTNPGLTKNSPLSEGIVLSLSDNPFEPVPFDPIYIKPGTFASIAMSLETSELKLQSDLRLFKPPCRPKPDHVLLKGPYHPESCVNDCFARSTLHICNCTMIITNIVNETRICNPDDTMICVTKFMATAYSTNQDDAEPDMTHTKRLFHDCTHSCLQIPCDRNVAYKHSISYATFPAAASKKKIEQELGWKMSRQQIERFDVDSLIKLTFYFPIIGYSRIEIRETQTIDQLIANIGGQLGLWIGASVVTIVQAIVYLLACWASIWKSVARGRIGPESTEGPKT